MNNNKVAPHEGDELNLVMMGVKPLASIDSEKQPEQFSKLRDLKHVLSIEYQDATLATVTKKENKDLHAVFRVLSASNCSGLAKSAEEKHTLLGRLFGYSEDQIRTFLEAGLECACGQCTFEEYTEKEDLGADEAYFREDPVLTDREDSALLQDPTLYGADISVKDYTSKSASVSPRAINNAR